MSLTGRSTRTFSEKLETCYEMHTINGQLISYINPTDGSVNKKPFLALHKISQEDMTCRSGTLKSADSKAVITQSEKADLLNKTIPSLFS